MKKHSRKVKAAIKHLLASHQELAALGSLYLKSTIGF